MALASRYVPPNPSLWQGRADSPASSYFFQKAHLLDLQKPLPETPHLAFGLLGFCCDEGIRRNLGRLGAAEGPAAIRSVLSTLPLQRRDIICYDAGDITCTDHHLEEAQLALANAVEILLNQNIVPIVLGGGHEVAWGHFQGIAKQYQTQTLTTINFDAHVDMRPLLPGDKGSSGTPFLQIAEAEAARGHRMDYHCIGIQRSGNIETLFTTAANYQTHILFADDIQQNEQPTCSAFMDRAIHHNQVMYVSICLDVFASAYAPGVSAPQAFGLTPWQVVPALRKLATSGKVISYDIAELSPPLDVDSRTAKLAASLIYEIIHHHVEYHKEHKEK